METPSVFQGFAAPQSNTLYTPNQFFDVVLPHSSRGAIRLVSYLLRRTLGWVNRDGVPINTEAYASYKELETKAGIGHSAIRAAIDEALDKRYIECLTVGSPHVVGQAGYTALYRLRWDPSGEYLTDPYSFDGFYRGNAHLTYVPNAFFDHLIPREKLSVIRVVGAIMRNSIGFQETQGFRRQRVAMSLTELQRKTRLHKETAGLGIQEALSRGYLKREQDGIFSPDAAVQRAATYSVRWAGETADLAATASMSPASSGGTLRKSVQSSDEGHSENPSRETLRKSVQEHSDIPSRNTPKIRPEERSENPSSIEITDLNNTPKQQQAHLDVVAGDSLRFEVMRDLLDPEIAGFTRSAAIRLVENYPVERIRKVLDTLSTEGARSKPAVITSAVKDGGYRLDPRPIAVPAETQFAGGFYRGRATAGADEGEGTVATPSRSDLATAGPVVRRLLGKRTPGEPTAWGESFGKFVRAVDTGPRKIATLTLAVKAHGDDWIRSVEAEMEKGRRSRLERARTGHQEAHSATYEAYLAAEAHRFEKSNHEAFQGFLEEQEESARRIERSSLRSERAKSLALADLRSEAGRHVRFRDYFVERRLVLGFWEWDQRINPRKFMEESV